jgi:hypothetical protein
MTGKASKKTKTKPTNIHDDEKKNNKIIIAMETTIQRII